MFYAQPWIERAETIAKALGRMIDEHGAPNRFPARDVSEATGMPVNMVYRVGRHGGEFVVRSSVVVYRAGWFDVSPRGELPSCSDSPSA